MPDLLRLDVLSCVLSATAYIAIGRKKWWGWLVTFSNLFVLTAINLKYNFWAFHFFNAFMVYITLRNAWRWRKDGQTQ